MHVAAMVVVVRGREHTWWSHYATVCRVPEQKRKKMLLITKKMRSRVER